MASPPPHGGYYAGGTRTTLTGSVGYRVQPFVAISGTTSYDDIRLPRPSEHVKFWLVGPRFDVTMTNTLFLTAYVQYNEQQRNMNLNTRLQWRYPPGVRPVRRLDPTTTCREYLQPGQDLPGMFRVKNRALVVKCAYWWNF